MKNLIKLLIVMFIFLFVLLSRTIKTEKLSGDFILRDIESNPDKYRMLRIECSLKGETKLITLQRYFFTTATLKTEKPEFDKCVITEGSVK